MADVCVCGHDRAWHDRRGECWGGPDSRSCMSSCREYKPMTEECERLRVENARLRRDLDDAHKTIRAFVRGDTDG